MNAPMRLRDERYGKDVPLLLRLLGCWAIQGKSYRFIWGEFDPSFGLTLQYSVYHESACIRICLIWGALYIHVPMIITQRPGTEDWNATYGFTFLVDSVHFNRRDKTKVIYMPWAWEHVRHDYLWPDGSLHHRAQPREYRAPASTAQRSLYTYVRKNGEIQQRIATVNGEEREWRWRWFTWSPWPRRISRTLNIEFDKEIGERVGSWKGGTVGCGWEWPKGETMLEALRRMERERKFN